MNKKIKSGIAAVLACLMFAGCSNGADTSSVSEESSSQSDTASQVTEESEAADSSTDSSTADSTESGDTESTADGTDEDDRLSDNDSIELTPALWLVTSPEGETMYMMGSMHALRKNCYPLPDYVSDAYEQADVLAVECDITDLSSSFSASVTQMENMYFEEGTLSDHVSEETYNNLDSYFTAHGMDIADYEDYQLWYLSSLLESIAIDDANLMTGEGIDGVLLTYAHDDGKEIYEVESIDFQVDLLLNFSEETYEMLISSYSAEESDSLVTDLLDMYEAWKTGDLTYFEESADVSEETLKAEYPDMTDEQIDLYLEYNKQLVTDRNIGMAEKAEELMSSGKSTFYIVGMGHFVGDGGIIDLMEQDGYTFELVTD